MRIYVGNLSYSTTQDSLEAEFNQFGNVDEVYIATDRETGRPRGFAFVTMSNDNEGREAIEKMDGVELDGRTLRVNEAKPRENTGGGGGGGGGGGRGGGRRDNRW